MEIYNIGLVIEGGGMRGIFSAGVLDYLMEKDINFPYVIGVSMGACNGSSYVSKQIKRSVRIPLTYLDDWRYLSFKSYLKEGNLFGMDFIFNKIPYELDPFDFETFEKSNKKFISVVTSCETGKARYFEKSDLTRASFLKSLEASTSLPFLSTMKEIDGEKFLDGGISDSIPVLKAYKDGYKKQVVILTREYEYSKKSSSVLKLITPVYYKKFPELAESIINRAEKYNETLDYIKRQEKAGNYFVIRPFKVIEMPRVGKDKDKLKEAYDLGYNQMELLYNDLKIFLES
ncbi:patatin family protein [Clostridiaceae bacterium HSG29]|nr:patatin family protein [Clostridiaceae bacterium HSG29]